MGRSFNCKAIFFDMDGTLTDLRDHSMPDSAKLALRKARENGIKVFLATGRHPLFMRKNSAVSDVIFDARLTTNGQLCFNEQEIIHRKTIQRSDIQALVSQLRDQPCPLMFIAEDALYLNMIDERVRRGNAVLDAPLVTVCDPSELADQDILSLLLYGGEDFEKKPMSVMPNCKTVRWHADYTDVIPIDGGKDAGIDAMLAYYNIDLCDTMAFGDAHNDLDMLRHVGLGVAMGNASELIKEHADYITGRVEEDGIYHALIKFGVI